LITKNVFSQEQIIKLDEEPGAIWLPISSNITILASQELNPPLLPTNLTGTPSTDQIVWTWERGS
jgi:hypothetical protein